MASKNEPLTFEIVSHIGTISTSKSGWTTEVNRVSWNNGMPKYDIRSWSPDHVKMGKGITFNDEELEKLSEILCREITFLKEDQRPVRSDGGN